MTESEHNEDVLGLDGLTKTVEALSQYADLVEQHGLNSPQVKAFFDQHQQLPQFQELAGECQRLEQQASFRPAPPATAPPEPRHSRGRVLAGAGTMVLLVSLAVGAALIAGKAATTEGQLAETRLTAEQVPVLQRQLQVAQNKAKQDPELGKVVQEQTELLKGLRSQLAVKDEQLVSNNVEALNRLSTITDTHEYSVTIAFPRRDTRPPMFVYLDEVALIREKGSSDLKRDLPLYVRVAVKRQDEKFALKTISVFKQVGQSCDPGTEEISGLIEGLEEIRRSFVDSPLIQTQTNQAVRILQARNQK